MPRPVIVLDDDPTGTQTIRDVPVLTRTDPDHLRWAFDQGGAGFFILTNTRSLGPAEAAARVDRIAGQVRAVAAERGLDPVFLARGDSTLRGHFPLETDVLREHDPAAGVLLVPAYLDAGRITVGGTHYVAGPDGVRTPVGETEFARDATFGFTQSHLPAWVEEQTGGRIRASEVLRIGLDDIRLEGADRVRELLRKARDGRVVVVDAERDDDLRIVAEAVQRAEAEGQRFVYRTGPSFVRARLGQSASAPVSAASLRAEGAVAGGLVVVGSHVAMTTRQLERLISVRDPLVVELDADRPSDRAQQGALADEIVAALAERTVVFRTSRTLRRGRSAQASLAIAREVSAAVVDVVRAVLERTRPAFLVAKGGITSSDVATEALGMSRARVEGTVLPGIVSVWRPIDGLAPDLPYVVFAGNVGGEDGLLDVVTRLEASAARPSAR